MSAMGSLVISLLLPLPASLDHTGDLAIQGELPEAQTADAELAQVSARPPAAPAAVAMPALELGRLCLPRQFQLQIFRDFAVVAMLLVSPIYCRNGIPI
jgi:hypothetical protein